MTDNRWQMSNGIITLPVCETCVEPIYEGHVNCDCDRNHPQPCTRPTYRHAAAQSAALVAVLREVEWWTFAYCFPCGKAVRVCLICNGSEPPVTNNEWFHTHGHAPDCRLAAALQEPPHVSENTRELADEIAREQADGRREGVMARPVLLINNIPGEFRYCRRCRSWFNPDGQRIPALPTSGGAVTYRNKACRDRNCAAQLQEREA